MSDDWRMCELCISLISSSLAGIAYMYMCLFGSQSELMLVYMCIWFGVVYNSVVAFVKKSKVWSVIILFVWVVFSDGVMKIVSLFSDVTYREMQAIVLMVCIMCFIVEHLYSRCREN